MSKYYTVSRSFSYSKEDIEDYAELDINNMSNEQLYITLSGLASKDFTQIDASPNGLWCNVSIKDENGEYPFFKNYYKNHKLKEYKKISCTAAYDCNFNKNNECTTQDFCPFRYKIK